MKGFGYTLTAVAMGALVLGAATALAGSSFSGRFGASGHHRLFLTCAGSGKPAVVLDSGLGNDHTAWMPVSEIARAVRTRVCAYDRYGLGRSDGTKTITTRTIGQAAADLHALLRSARVEGPYVFSAQSIGGLIDREYARRYPKDVAGMALFDTAPDNWDIYTGTKAFLWGNECLNVTAASAALRAHDTIHAKPLVVVEAGNDAEVQQFWAAGKTDFQHYWDSSQRVLAKISTNSIFVVATGVVHEIPENAPELTNAAIKLVLDAARTHRKLPGCARTKLPRLGGNCNAAQATAPSPGESDTDTTTTDTTT